MAAKRCFDVVELLEHILLHLPFKEIFKARLVTKSWKLQIQRSIRLRRAIFLAPDGETVQLDNHAYLFHLKTLDEWEMGPVLETRDTSILPVFNSLAPLDQEPPPRDYRELSFNPNDESREVVMHVATLEPNLNIGETWPNLVRSMFLTQPPVICVNLRIDWVGRDGWLVPRVEATVHRTRGITLGEIIEVYKLMLNSMTVDQTVDLRVKSNRLRLSAEFLSSREAEEQETSDEE